MTKVIDEIPIDDEEMDNMLDITDDPLEQTVNNSNELPTTGWNFNLSSEGTGQPDIPPAYGH